MKIMLNRQNRIDVLIP